MRLHCKRCHDTVHGNAFLEPLKTRCAKCGGPIVANPEPYRLHPMPHNPHPSTLRRTRHPLRECRVCNLAMKRAPRLWVHVVSGGSHVVHKDDSAELTVDFGEQYGDCGLQEVGPDCAKLFPREFLVEWQGCTRPRDRSEKGVRARAAKFFG